MEQDTELVKYLNKVINSKENYLDFVGEDMGYSTHKYHDYPATMIPKMPDLFINAVTKFSDIKNIYDPFMGSGTTLVEGIRHNLEAFGVDLNPLAVLMTRVKTKKLPQDKLEQAKRNIYSGYEKELLDVDLAGAKLEIPDFKNVNYWFKPNVIKSLQIIKDQILKIEDQDIKEFFLLTFSVVVRYSSNSRNSEFKMYRMAPSKLSKWDPDVFGKFKEVTDRNVYLNSLLNTPKTSAHPIFGTSQKLDNISDNSFDLLITSPPYGDSKTTVAYGQFSRTSLQWLNLKDYPADKVPKLDRTLLGGKVTNKEFYKTPSPTLNNLLEKIEQEDSKRALEVLQFYSDLYVVLKETVRVMKPNSYQFWVTGNRTVKGIKLPTDVIIAELYKSLNVKKLAEYERNIPNKRMPSKNSPTNQKGKKISTMKKENIVLYKTIK